jgi:hypothetical protein
MALRVAHCCQNSAYPIEPLPIFQRRQADGALNRNDGHDGEQRPQAELEAAAG